MGLESGNQAICDGRDLPWLQEAAGTSAWADWRVASRDVVILDTENEPITTYNLTDHDLRNPANAGALKDLLRGAVPVSPAAWGERTNTRAEALGGRPESSSSCAGRSESSISRQAPRPLPCS